MSTAELTDSAYSLLRFYLREYDGLKDKRPSEKKENLKKVPTLFVPPVASCGRFKRVRGYRLCWNIGAVEIYRNGLGSSKNNVSSTFLKTLPSFPAFSKSWANALNALERLQERKLPMKSALKFRVTVLGLPRSSSGSTAVPETCTTQFVATWLGQGIREAFGWKVDLQNYEVEVVATLLTNETAARQVGVLSLGLTLCRATTSECLAGLLANQRTDTTVLNPLKSKENLKAIHGHFIVNQMLSIANDLHEPRASWCLVRRAIKSVYFRRKLLNVANKRGETPMILAAKACDSRLVSLILALGKRKLKESKLQPQLQQHFIQAEDIGDRRIIPIRGDLMKRDNQQYDALMHSCERGDNSTVSVLLNHKSGTFNWGFNKLCERCLSVASSASQHHTLSLVLNHLFNGKGSRAHPSLCWPALQSSIETGNSLTVALILDYMRMFASRSRTKEEERMNSKSSHFSHSFPIPQKVFMGLQSQSVFDLLSRAHVLVLCGDRAVDMKTAFPSGFCSTSIISTPSSSATVSTPKLSSASSTSLLTCLLKEKKMNQILQSPSLPIPIRKGKGVKKDDDAKLSCGPPSMLQIELFGDERTGNKKCGKEKKDLQENFHLKGVMTEVDGKGDEGSSGLDDTTMDEIALDSPTQPSKSRISKPKKLRIVGGRSSSSHFKFYENEKKLWLKQLLDDTNESQLCSSVLQLILTYIVV